MFAQVTSTGHFCLSDAPVDAPLMGGGGCNPPTIRSVGSAISASLAFDGGPAIETVRDARLIGLAAPRCRERPRPHERRIEPHRQAEAGEGRARTSSGVFGYRFRKSDLKKGIGPVAVVAYDDGGAEIGRQTTGIG